MDSPALRPSRAPRVAPAGVAGLVLGSAAGAAEMAARLLPASDPSVARRGFELVGYAGLLYGICGALLFGAAALLARVLVRGGDAASVDRADRAGRIELGAVIAALVLALLSATLGERLWERGPGVRAGGALAGALAAGALAWLVVRVAGPLLLRRARLLAAAAVLLWLAALGAAAAVERRAQPVLAAAPAVPTSGTAAAADLPNLLLVVVDTLRADVLGCYGGRAATPRMDALAARGALFEQVVAPTSWTLPSVATLLTSTAPSVHGVTDYDRFVPRDLASLPTVLGAAGYRSLAVVGNPLLSTLRRFDRGFDFYDCYAQELEARLLLVRALWGGVRLAGALDHDRRSLVPRFESRFPFVGADLTFYVRDRDLNRRLVAFAPKLGRAEEAPTFLYVHETNPHAPYLEHPLRALPAAGRLVPEERERILSRYEAEVAYTDSALGALLDQLEASGFLEGATVVVTADHGEEFLEHGGWEHGKSLHREVLRVPWIVAGPGVEPGLRVTAPVQLQDVAPTLLGLAGVAAPESFAGRDLSGVLRGEPDRVDEELADEEPAWLELSSRFLTPGSSQVGVLTARHKLIERRDAGGALVDRQAWDLVLDPQETSPLAELPPELRARLPELESLAARVAATTGGEATPEDRAAMRALGYLGEDAEEP